MEEEDYIIVIIQLSMKVILLMINMKEEEDIIGKMENIILENG